MTSHTHYIDAACIQSMRASANFRPDESPHSAHLCTFSLVWISSVFLERRLGQMTSYNWSMCWLWLTALWVSVCVYRVQSWANNIWQWSQVYAVLYCYRLQFSFPDFLLYRMTSHILNKSSSMLLSIQAVSSLGLAWIGNTQLSTAPVCWTERSLSLNSAQTLKDFDLVALLNTTFC